jgi:protein-disulfide isomerase
LLYAEDLGIDVPRFARELAAAVHASRVRDDYRSGIQSGVTGTPTFFINSARYVGASDVDSLVRAIERARPQPLSPLRGSDVRT